MEAQRVQAEHFLNSGRGDLAIPVLHELLAQDPEDPGLVSLLGVALWMTNRFEEGLKVAEQALALDGSLPLAHYYRCLCARRLGLKAKAKESAAVLLENAPHDPDSWYLKALLAHDANRHEDAIDASAEGLALAPEHGGCMHIRAESLMSLGRVEESAEQLDFAQSREPDDPFFHDSRGWVELRRGNRGQAREHFREALRLNPDHRFARKGMLECLRSFHPLYRGLLKYRFFMERFPPGHRVAVLVGLLFLSRILRSLASDMGYPMVGLGILIAYVTFCLMTFFLQPLTDLILMVTRDGRLTMTTEERRGSALFATLIGGGGALIVLGAAGPTDQSTPLFMLGTAAILFFLPFSGWREQGYEPRRRRLFGLLSLAIAACWLGAVVQLVLPGLMSHPPATTLAGIAFGGAILSTWLSV